MEGVGGVRVNLPLRSINMVARGSYQAITTRSQEEGLGRERRKRESMKRKEAERKQQVRLSHRLQRGLTETKEKKAKSDNKFITIEIIGFVIDLWRSWLLWLWWQLIMSSLPRGNYA